MEVLVQTIVIDFKSKSTMINFVFIESLNSYPDTFVSQLFKPLGVRRNLDMTYISGILLQ
jgi:hypothetical protein